MKYLLSILILISSEFNTYCQVESDTAKVFYDTYTDYEDLKRKQEEHGIDKLTYIDSTFKFKVAVPSWLNLKDAGTPRFWGGTLPPIKEIENAIGIKSYDKSGATFEDFVEYVTGGMVPGQKMFWDESHVSMGGKILSEYEDLGKSFKLYFLWNGLIYHCQYVLTQSETAFIWIDYTATQETFDESKQKFDEFMSGFEILK